MRRQELGKSFTTDPRGWRKEIRVKEDGEHTDSGLDNKETIQFTAEEYKTVLEVKLNTAA